MNEARQDQTNRHSSRKQVQPTDTIVEQTTSTTNNTPTNTNSTQSTIVITGIERFDMTWVILFIVSIALGSVIFGLGLQSVVGYTLHRRDIISNNKDNIPQEITEELHSELRSSILVLCIGTILLTVAIIAMVQMLKAIITPAKKE